MARKSFTMNDDLKELWDRVKNAEEYHKAFYVKNIENNNALLRGDTSYLPKNFEFDIINPNLLFSTIRNYVPSLYPAHPKIFAKPTAPEWGDAKKDNAYSAFIAQNALDYYQIKLECKQTDKFAILGSLVHGLAYVMDSWVAETGNVNPILVKDQPLHRFVSGIDLIPDPDGLEFEDKSFVVRVFGKRYDQMLKLGYKSLIDKKAAIDDNGYKGVDPKTHQPILPKFYEIWDKNTEKRYIICEENSVPNGLDEKEWNIRDGFPFTPLILNPMIDNFYPMSVVDVIKEMQKFITLMVSYGVQHTKRAIPKQMGFVEYMDAATKRALTSGKVMDFIPLRRKQNDDHTPAEQIIASMRVPGLPADYYNMLNIVRDFLNTVSGVSESARGGNQKQETATGMAIVDNYLRSRIGDYKEIVDDFIVASRRKMLKQIKRNASTDRYLRFNKKDIFSEFFYVEQNSEFQQNVKAKGDYVFIPWNKENISDEYDLELGVGSGLPTNEEFTYKKALNNYNMMANDPRFDPVKTRLHFLREIKVPDAEKWITPPPPPPPPEKPKVSIGVSIKGEELGSEALAQLLTQANILKDESQPLPQPGAGNGQNGNKVGPVDAGLQRELGLMSGLQTPPNMPEIQGGNNG
jgi:hypothetical protein